MSLWWEDIIFYSLLNPFTPLPRATVCPEQEAAEKANASAEIRGFDVPDEFIVGAAVISAEKYRTYRQRTLKVKGIQEHWHRGSLVEIIRLS